MWTRTTHCTGASSPAYACHADHVGTTFGGRGSRSAPESVHNDHLLVPDYASRRIVNENSHSVASGDMSERAQYHTVAVVMREREQSLSEWQVVI